MAEAESDWMVHICGAIVLRTAIVSAVVAALFSTPATADLVISKRPTDNVSCNAGACAAIAKNAVLNVGQLANLLASQANVSVDAGPAKDIAVKAPLSWTSSTPFTLIASGVVSVNKPMTAAGHAALSIQSKELLFASKASLTFWDLSSSLAINGNAYKLE